MIAATWSSEILRVWRITSSFTSPILRETSIGHFRCDQVLSGKLMLDSAKERLFALIEPSSAFSDGQHELLVVDIRQPIGGGGGKPALLD